MLTFCRKKIKCCNLFRVSSFLTVNALDYTYFKVSNHWKLSIVLSRTPMKFLPVCFPYELVDSRISIGCWIEIASMLLNGFLI